MLDSVLNVVYLVGALITVLGALGAAYALVRGSYNRARIERLREDNEDLRNRIDTLEAAEQRHDEAQKAWEKERAHLVSENQTLLLAATQRAEVEVLRTQMEEYQVESMAAWGRIEELLSELVGKGGDPHA